MKKENYSITISIIAIAISAVTIALLSIHSAKLSYVSLETFIGVIAAFIGICTTFIIAYQIINTIEIKSKIRELDHLKTEIETDKKKLELLENETQEIVLKIIAELHLRDGQMGALMSFKTGHEVLIYALKANRNNFDDNFNGLKSAILKLDYYDITLHAENLEKYLKDIQEQSITIKKSDNYAVIKYVYEHIMVTFYTRLENAKNGSTVSPDERAEICR